MLTENFDKQIILENVIYNRRRMKVHNDIKFF